MDVNEPVESHVEDVERSELDRLVRDALWAYHGSRYRDLLGLREWERRATDRLDEERLVGEKMVGHIEKWFGYEFAGKRVLVVGTGTGAEFATLGNRGASVYGIDVNREAVSIVRLKGRARGRSAAVAPCAASGGDRC